MTALEQQLSPLMREAIRTLRKRWHSVEVKRVESGADEPVLVMVQVEKDDEPRPRIMWEDEHGNVFHQSRVKTNGHYGPRLRVNDQDRTPPSEPAPKRALRRSTVRRMREDAIETRANIEPSLWGKRMEAQNALTRANRDFMREPTRMNLALVQTARLVLNKIDEAITTEFENDAD